MKPIKKFTLVSLVIASCICTASAVNYQETFFKANDFYKAGNYEHAAQLYEQIPHKNVQVHYNLGNCAYKQGNFGRALAHWRRAEKDWGFFNRTELLHNIAMVKQKTKQQAQTEETPLEKTKNAIEDLKNITLSFVRATPLFTLQLIFLLMWLVSFLYLRYLYRKRKQTIIVLLFLADIFCGTLLALKYNFEYREHGVVVAKQVNLMSGPGKNYQVLSIMPEAKEILILAQADGFYKVKANRIIGWIEQTAVEKY